MEYEFSKDPSVDWETVVTADRLEAVIKELGDVRVYAWDVETNGLRPYNGDRAVGHGFAWRRSNGQIKSIYIPLRHKSYMGLLGEVKQLPVEQVNAAIKPILEGPALKCGHNLSFDCAVAVQDGIYVTPKIHDTLVAARLIDENRPNYRLASVLIHSEITHQRGWKRQLDPDLKAQVRHFGISVKELTNRHGYEFVDLKTIGHYGNQDAVYELRLAEWQIPHVNQWAAIWAMEMELFHVCFDMQCIGLPVSKQVLEDLAVELQTSCNDVAPQIWKLAGEEFKINNDNELRRILFKKMGYPSKGQTKQNQDSVNDDVLWQLEKHDKAPIAPLIRKYNQAYKILSVYTDGLIALIDNQGIVHGQIDQSGARTGRVSMSKPNLQNIPNRTEIGRKVRAAFKCRPGMVRYCIDFSQAELRVLAHISQDPLLLKVYREGADVHATTAKEAFGSAGKIDGVDLRRTAKILNFGIPFCITEIGVKRNINKELPPGVPEITTAKAKGYLDSWYSKYRGVSDYKEWLRIHASHNDGTVYNLFGRPRRIPAINHEESYKREAALRYLVSSMVQGSAADLVKYVMVACWKYIKSQSNCEAYLVNMVHDDLQFDMMPEGSAKCVRDLKHIMENTCKLSVPIIADVEYCLKHWGAKTSMTI